MLEINFNSLGKYPVSYCIRPGTSPTPYTQRANDAAALQTDIEELEASVEQKIGQCEQLLGFAEGQNAQSKGTTLFETLQIRDLLLAVNRGNEQTLENWGFGVAVSSAAAPKKKQKPA